MKTIAQQKQEWSKYLESSVFVERAEEHLALLRWCERALQYLKAHSFNIASRCPEEEMADLDKLIEALGES